jgi:hypothetical protein
MPAQFEDEIISRILERCVVIDRIISYSDTDRQACHEEIRYEMYSDVLEILHFEN